MRCPACQNDAVAGAVFCNHCGAPIPVTCHQCTATNPPLSKFCHRCGATLSSADDIPTTSTSSTTEPTLGDVGVDFKVLAVDVARYSAPRIRTGAIFAARISKRSVISAAAGIKRISATIARRANRPKPSTGEPVPGQEPPPAAPSRPVAVALSPASETPATDPPPNEGRTPSPAPAAMPSTRPDRYSASTAACPWTKRRRQSDPRRATPAPLADSGSGLPRR